MRKVYLFLLQFYTIGSIYAILSGATHHFGTLAIVLIIWRVYHVTVIKKTATV